MTKIKAAFLEGDTKYHISRPGGGPACNADAYFPYSNKTELPRKSVCKNCLRSSRAEYEEIPKHIAEMPDGYRMMKVGETITEDTMVWSLGTGPWVIPDGYWVGKTIAETHLPACCPVAVQKTPEMSDNADSCEPVTDKCEYCKETGYYGDNGPGIEGNEEYHECDQCNVDPENCDCRFWARTDLTLDEASVPLRHHPRCEHRVEYHGGFATPDNADRLQDRIADLEEQVEELNAANDELSEDDANQVQLIGKIEKERDELKRKVAQLIAIDKRVTDYIDDLHREHETEVNELKRKLDASAEASTHERTTVNLLTYKLEKAEKFTNELGQEIAELHESRGSYMLATKGHTIENITTIMEAMPPAEELEGQELHIYVDSKDSLRGLILEVTAEPIIEYNEPELVYCLQQFGCGFKKDGYFADVTPVRMIEGEAYQMHVNGPMLDLIEATDANNIPMLWLGHWNDGIERLRAEK